MWIVSNQTIYMTFQDLCPRKIKTNLSQNVCFSYDLHFKSEVLRTPELTYLTDIYSESAGFPWIVKHMQIKMFAPWALRY